ncbi:MAG TPA: branched-chain amino acid ABC transporter permease [Candidatus Dormibacteraeota bacterium]|nr:branched-chain amino acid ABC transporter permease [Candidatus Dormibacteraeota bacterium]
MLGALAHFYALHSKLIDQIGINAIFALSLSLTLQAGHLALANSAFGGIAAYVASLLSISRGWPLTVTTLIGAAAAALVGALIGWPVTRLRGVFLAIATIGFGEIALIVENNLSVTGGAEGLAQIPNETTTWKIYLVLAILAFFFWRLRDTRAGWAMAAVREDEYAAASFGIDPARVKFWTFVGSAAIAGIAGSLYAHENFFISPGDWGFGRMIDILVYCVIGGVSSPWGAMLGAAIISSLPEVFRFLHNYRDIVNGLVLLLVVIFAPQGIAGLWSRERRAPQPPAAAEERA